MIFLMPIYKYNKIIYYELVLMLVLLMHFYILKDIKYFIYTMQFQNDINHQVNNLNQTFNLFQIIL